LLARQLGRFACSSAGWLAGWLAGWMDGERAGGRAGRQAGWLAGWLARWLAGLQEKTHSAHPDDSASLASRTSRILEQSPPSAQPTLTSGTLGFKSGRIQFMAHDWPQVGSGRSARRSLLVSGSL